MVNKKAFMKTLEAIIATMILLIFVVEVIPKSKEDPSAVPIEIESLQDTIFNTISSSDSLRSCALNENDDCINTFINDIMYEDTSYAFTITSIGSSLVIPSLPEDKAVYTKSEVIAANLEVNDPKLLTLYLWKKL